MQLEFVHHSSFETRHENIIDRHIDDFNGLDESFFSRKIEGNRPLHGTSLVWWVSTLFAPIPPALKSGISLEESYEHVNRQMGEKGGDQLPSPAHMQ